MWKLLLGLGLAVLPLFVFAKVYLGERLGVRMVTRLAVTVKSRCTYANAVTPGAHKLTNPNPACQVHPGARSVDTLTADAGADPGPCYRVRAR